MFHKNLIIYWSYLLISSDIYIIYIIYIYIFYIYIYYIYISIHLSIYLVGGLEHVFIIIIIFPYIENVIIPTVELIVVQRGRSTTNQLSIDYIYWFLLIYLSIYIIIYIYIYLSINLSIYLSWLVVSTIFYVPFRVWDNHSHWLSYFSEG